MLLGVFDVATGRAAGVDETGTVGALKTTGGDVTGGMGSPMVTVVLGGELGALAIVVGLAGGVVEVTGIIVVVLVGDTVVVVAGGTVVVVTGGTVVVVTGTVVVVVTGAVQLGRIATVLEALATYPSGLKVVFTCNISVLPASDAGTTKRLE